MTPTFQTIPAERDLDVVAEKYPENLIFYSTKQLSSALDNLPIVQAEVAAELCIRCFLSGQSSILDLLVKKDVITLEEQNAFQVQLPLSNGMRVFGDMEFRFTKSALLKGCFLHRFEILSMADGLIPVFKDGSRGGGQEDDPTVLLLPFQVTSASEENKPAGCFYLNGSGEVSEWSRYLKEMDLNDCRIILLFHQDYSPELKGRSMMLPVLLAWTRHHGIDGITVPKYNPFSIVATGAFDRGNTLRAVETKPKANGLDNLLFQPTFIYPDDDTKLPTETRFQTLPLLVHSSREKILSEIRVYLEKNVRWDNDYTIHRCQEILDETRYKCKSNWDDLIARIRNSKPDKIGYPREYILRLVILGEACSHAGRTDKAIEYNNRARTFLENKKEFIEFYLLLRISRLIPLLDIEDFDTIKSLIPDLRKDIEQVKESKWGKDLMMRFLGTMGRIHAFGACAGLESFSPEESIRLFMEAASYAKDHEKSKQELAQDLNNIHLFYALFAPGTEDETEAWDEAYTHCRSLDKDTCGKNLHFLISSKLFAWYRILLGKKVIPSEWTSGAAFRQIPEFKPFLYEPKKNDWVYAMAAKYAAALESASGQEQEAKNLFQYAWDAIPSVNSDIIQSLKLSLCAEAYRSLSDPIWLQTAKELAGSIKYSYVSLPHWEKWLDNPKPDQTFPGLMYWY